ncbi:hypothetical protein H1R20_g4922, partial [Candolleomyces eurysporus]
MIRATSASKINKETLMIWIHMHLNLEPGAVIKIGTATLCIPIDFVLAQFNQWHQPSSLSPKLAAILALLRLGRTPVNQLYRIVVQSYPDDFVISVKHIPHLP